MTSYEYKVVPAPQKGEKARGIKTAEGRFACAIERAMNDMAADGWEYLRSETLPSEERSGLTSSTSVWRNLLVFRRARMEGTEAESAVAEGTAALEGRRLASAADLARSSQMAPPVPGPLRPDPAPRRDAGSDPHTAGEGAADTEAPATDDKHPAGG
ncbi:hypothetical protein AL036_08275 [Salipiger aestuarii]|uniref:DUF4177 domain-containing protein n=1 Tax=Salipiger aestuarii TaxID=568098 RepID=A0A327YDF9_9RHOB|nr:DUF4177 domain-containing protein [Salipiger aestuarii]KAA8608117.1 hypothetical protein AL036_08275 [Salipiger aestuarii]KAB2542061.1 hypothetical protein AL035_09030 [Salipiger aestuarii]RAK16499.1 hypothetical protein ATI53_102035 [Salipiger aestuarii]